MQIVKGAGLWAAPAAGVDEIYVVTTGQARIATPQGAAEVGRGSVIFVPAGEEHHFIDVTDDLALLVVFSPAYTGG
jgi:mannose-6-phosphate isomerase-like protein (cupin superfamily)